jgi:hypothetical protein
MKNGNFIKNVSCGIFLFGLSQAQADAPPNFLVILADDLGWGDVGFNRISIGWHRAVQSVQRLMQRIRTAVRAGPVC